MGPETPHTRLVREAELGGAGYASDKDIVMVAVKQDGYALKSTY